MSRASERVSIAVGLLAGFFALGLFGWAVGYRRVVATVAGLRPLPFSLGFLAVVGAVACQYLSLTALLSVRPSVDSALAFLRGIYGRQLIPVGNVAGPVLVAYSMRTATGIPTDRGLPAALIAQAATFLASTVVALVGALLLVAGGRSGLLPVAGVFAALVLGWLVVLGALVGGVDLDRIVHWVASLLNRTIGRVSVTVATRTDPEAVQRALEEFDDARALIRDDPARIGAALGWAVVGWVLFTVPAVTTANALDTSIPLAVAFVAVPVSDLLNVLPVPGGLGGVEVAMAGIFVALTPVGVAPAAVVAFCVRLCTYWFLLLLSGTGTTVLSARTAGS